MPGVHDIEQQMQRNPREIQFRCLCRVYDHYCGRFVVRAPEEVHRRLAIQAAESGISLNRLAGAKLSR